MANLSPECQIGYVMQWFKSWSELQKDDFIQILLPKCAQDQYVNGLVNGVQNLTTEPGRPPSLFNCQIKLFNEWWETWNATHRENFKKAIQEEDPAFWGELERAIKGETKKEEDDFYLTTEENLSHQKETIEQEQKSEGPKIEEVAENVIVTFEREDEV